MQRYGQFCVGHKINTLLMCYKLSMPKVFSALSGLGPKLEVRKVSVSFTRGRLYPVYVRGD